MKALIIGSTVLPLDLLAHLGREVKMIPCTNDGKCPLCIPKIQIMEAAAESHTPSYIHSDVTGYLQRKGRRR